MENQIITKTIFERAATIDGSLSNQYLTDLEDIGIGTIEAPFPITEKKLIPPDKKSNWLLEAITNEAGQEVCNYLGGHFDLTNSNSVLFASPAQKNNVFSDFDSIRVIINLKKLNHIAHINDYLIATNKLLPDAGLLMGCVETYESRRSHIFKKFINPLAHLTCFVDFIINRVLPRLGFTRELYLKITNGKLNAISRAEALGRIAYCGFDIIESHEINGLNYFVVMKTSEPKKGVTPSSGAIFPMRRVGKNGKLIKVYKFRTMHPYSEFIQDYVVKTNGYNVVGKPDNDFRVTNWGKVFRKLWLDELPQLINVFMGQIGMVGVRPLSMTRFNELPLDVQLERIKYLPGCIPPYVALNMPDALGNIEAERIYFRDREKHGRLITHSRYFVLALYNILTNKIRSS